MKRTNMLRARWISPPCRKPDVTIRHHSLRSSRMTWPPPPQMPPSPTAFPQRAPWAKIEPSVPDGPRRQELQHEDDDVDPDQDVGGLTDAGDGRSSRPHLGDVARAFGAAHADGGRRHAVGADRPPAAGAADARLAVGMSVAGGQRVRIARSGRTSQRARPVGRAERGRQPISAVSTGFSLGSSLPPFGSRVTITRRASESPCGIATSPTPPSATTKTEEGWTEPPAAPESWIQAW